MLKIIVKHLLNMSSVDYIRTGGKRQTERRKITFHQTNRWFSESMLIYWRVYPHKLSLQTACFRAAIPQLQFLSCFDIQYLSHRLLRSPTWFTLSNNNYIHLYVCIPISLRSIISCTSIDKGIPFVYIYIYIHIYIYTLSGNLAVRCWTWPICSWFTYSIWWLSREICLFIRRCVCIYIYICAYIYIYIHVIYCYNYDGTLW